MQWCINEVMLAYYSDFNADDKVFLLVVFFFWVQLFDKVEVFKPPASRSTSAETYLLGLGFKAPGKIDPKLLDYRHLFKETAEPTRKVITMSLYGIFGVVSATLSFPLKFVCYLLCL